MQKIDRNIHPLSVLSASAGSGKTHQLVLEYLSILLKDSQFKRKYKSLVAMTFTNKAASEMKERILSTLFGLAYDDPSNTKVANMRKDLIEQTELSAAELAHRSKLALEGILHAYEDFHVSTIDKFNLRLIRSFSRDLDLPADFEVILNEKQITEDVVDILMNQLGAPGAEDVSEWMYTYAKANLAEGNSWNFRKQLIEFSGMLSQEKNSEKIQQLLQLELTNGNYARLIEDRKTIVAEFLVDAKKVHDDFFGLDINHDTIAGKGKTVKDFAKLNVQNELPKGTSKDDGLFTESFLKLMEDGSKLNIPSSLKQDVIELNDRYMRDLASINLIELYRKNFFNMALLQHVGKQLQLMMNDEQLIRISEFNKLISKLVRDEEAPYIYERLGVRFEHFLLDEFQDTSRLQWLNLIPLILESLGHNRWNLIVGDAKQSIYRFNNGLAEQFVSLPAIYNPENDPHIAYKSSMLASRGVKRVLDSNYRSAKEIVEFNNALFKGLAQNLPASMAHFYQDLEQKAQRTKKGYIHIESVKQKLTFEERLEKVIGFVEESLHAGFEPGDICILTETNKMGNDLAIGLTERKYQVVSQDSLLVSKDAQVQLILSYLRRRASPRKTTETKRFAELYFRMKESFSTADYLSYFEVIQKDGKSIRVFNDSRFLAEHFGGTSAFFTTYESVYDLVQKFMLLMNWQETKEPYLHHFMDVIYGFQLARQTDIHHFLEFFDAQKDKIALQMPDTQSALKIMTIHKSKGLEFPVVIIPNMDFTITMNSQAKYLMEVRDKILYAFPAKGQQIPELDAFAKEENNLILLDKMNLFYVGMTRPELRLYAINDFDKDKFGAMIHKQLEELNLGMNDDGLLKIGQTETLVKNEDSVTNLYVPSDFSQRLWYPDIVFRKVFQEESEIQLEEQRFGNDFHLLMSLCESKLDTDPVLTNLLREGQVEQKNEAKLRESALAFWQKIEAGDYLNNIEKSLNEQVVLAGENDVKKPDKVLVKSNEVLVIDFKTGKINQKHMEQIVAYGKLLEEIFKKPVRCLLYYSALNQLTEL
ncbi:MAG: UvrD-helicase domain-containing protein [Crocinitomicaceae bacterium]|nr:UvrD-helicase domain-containing protein [Crocinitomicaceae bacterium]MBP6032306.1 UvrD-helicase domain-containing protein [Crocinitomicaceae bacterium]